MSRYNMRVILKTIVVVILLAVVGIAVLVGTVWLDHIRETILPPPTGPFAVGRTTYIWSDVSHADLLGPPGAKRELFAWIWYPAVRRNSSQAWADYLPTRWRTAVAHQRSAPFKLLSRDLSRVRTHSTPDAEISPQQRFYPVVIMRAGLSGLVTGYTSLAEDLASHGYVVVGFDAPYRSSVVVFPDGRVIGRAAQDNLDAFSGDEQLQLANSLVEAWSADISFAVDQLERLNTSDLSGRFSGRLDMQRVGVFGHSLGGATALQFCHDDSRCKAGIDVDGAPLGTAITEGVSQPFMFLWSDHGSEWSDAEGREVEAHFRSIYDRLPSDRRLQIVLRGSNHYGFSDDGAMLKSPFLMRALHTLGLVRLDGRRQIAVTTHCISTFFGVYLKGEPASELKNESQYPEIEYVP